MAKLRPFRQINENDVVNLFAFDGSSATKGSIVKLDTTKVWKADNELEVSEINNGLVNTISDRYSVKARVALCSSGNVAFGMLMHDVKELDENGEKLLWHPRKAHEMQVALSGQAVPVLTCGIVLVNGIDVTSVAVGAGVKIYAGVSGSIVTHSDAPTGLKSGYLGYCLGGEAANGDVLIKLDPRSL